MSVFVRSHGLLTMKTLLQSYGIKTDPQVTPCILVLSGQGWAGLGWAGLGWTLAWAAPILEYIDDLLPLTGCSVSLCS